MTQTPLLREKELSTQRFLDSLPFEHSRRFAQHCGCDIAVPNSPGIGNIVCFTRLVEELALKLGRPVRLLTAPIKPYVGLHAAESKYPIWENNPFVETIFNADEVMPGAMNLINKEQDNYCQFNHIIENICYCHEVAPRHLRPSLFLNHTEQVWALNELKDLPRPLVCIHPSGTSSSLPNSPWHKKRWNEFISTMHGAVGFVQIGKVDYDLKSLDVHNVETTIRQMMAIIWASDLFVGFDSSPAHIATAFEKPSCVLWEVLRKVPIEEHHQPGFGASAVLRWSYPQNRNLMLLGERDRECLRLMVEFVKTESAKLFSPTSCDLAICEGNDSP